MTASTRFIVLALFAWVGVRAVSLGVLPGGAAALARVVPQEPAQTVLPPIEPTEFPAIEPAQSYPSEATGETSATTELVTILPRSRPMRDPPVRMAARPTADPYVRDYSDLATAEAELPPPRRLPFSMELAPPRPADPQVAAAMPRVSVPPTFVGGASTPEPLRRRRLELSAWALLRGNPGDLLGPNSLSTSSGTLGGSQAGARITYWVGPRLAASLRSSTPLGGARGGEVALGVRYQPFRGVPLAVTAERRQRFGRAGGRNDFALFMEGGLYDRPLPAGFRLDAYGQAGIVGIGARDLFGDGAVSFTRPLWRNISGGFGVWGGAQPGLYRLDAGPRLSIRMNRLMRIHLDYRQRLLGTASPSSGPAVTIAGDF